MGSCCQSSHTVFNEALPKRYFVGLNNLFPFLFNFLTVTKPLFPPRSSPPFSGPPVVSNRSGLRSRLIFLSLSSYLSAYSPPPSPPHFMSIFFPLLMIISHAAEFQPDTKKTNHTQWTQSVQERGQSVGSGAGQIQPGEWIHAGGINRRAWGLCHDAGGRAATLLQRSHWAVQNRCQHLLHSWKPFAFPIHIFVSRTNCIIYRKAP